LKCLFCTIGTLSIPTCIIILHVKSKQFINFPNHNFKSHFYYMTHNMHVFNSDTCIQHYIYIYIYMLYGVNLFDVTYIHDLLINMDENVNMLDKCSPRFDHLIPKYPHGFWWPVDQIILHSLRIEPSISENSFCWVIHLMMLFVQRVGYNGLASSMVGWWIVHMTTLQGISLCMSLYQLAYLLDAPNTI
jgi:hypothetical protein